MALLLLNVLRLTANATTLLQLQVVAHGAVKVVGGQVQGLVLDEHQLVAAAAAHI
jgi:hypothetical protein